MPFSAEASKPWIGERLRELEQIDRVLDIGVGAGRYSKLFRALCPDAEWIGVEIFSPYIERFGLTKLYDEIIEQDARSVDYTKLGNFDVAFCGDVLEHMTKDEAKTVIDMMVRYTGNIFISVPLGECPQGEVYGNQHEAHVSTYMSIDDLYDVFSGIVAHNISSQEDWTIGTIWVSKDAYMKEQAI
ncbi:class I SAM-dependent methyltransferase [uncultured Cohaesibacter sp.]|uniref:class I SAM-dependent methyltransferase n=1 Tax=uncultured Cohaesibacter sp. TaxID=1002546 RepID=UPI0029C65826|nr:class I SAM-dependent methyltransferase [uncultured Cohaesibacter sp.]